MKNKNHNSLIKVGILLSLFLIICNSMQAQLSVTFTTQLNYVCDGNPCDNYTNTGPLMLINEAMISSLTGDGSIYGDVYPNVYQGEWIELYNPNPCEPVDASCFYLGNNTGEYVPDYHGGGYRIPAGTIVPPNGFLIIRGDRAPAVDTNLLVQNGGRTIELVADSASGNICLGGGERFWFPNEGGWMALYDDMGLPQDAISWGSLTYSCLSCNPCVPSYSGCNDVPSLVSYFSIISSRKTYITPVGPPNDYGLSWRRIPDGGTWDSIPDTSTMGACNTICNPPLATACNGQAMVIVSGGTPPYSYSWNDPQTSSSDTATGLCAGNYCVTVTDANNNTISACVDIYNYPVAVFNNISPVCENANSFNLAPYVSPAGGIFSGAGITGSSFDPSAAGAGSHLVTYFYADTNGCSDTVSTIIIVNPIPNISISPNPATICYGDSVSLTGSGASTYSWSPATGLNATTGSVITASPATTTTYVVTGNLNGCVNDASVTVTVNPLPQIIPPNPVTICQGNSVMLSAGGASTYTWSPPTGLNITAGSTVIANPATTTTYTVAGTSNGCIGTADVTVTVISSLTISVSPNPASICPGDSVTLTASGNSATYAWSPSNGLNTTAGPVVIAYPNTSTTYVVTGTLNGCTNTTDVTVLVASTLSLSANSSDICNGDSATLTASGAVTYTWWPSNGLSATTGSSVIASPTTTTTYTIVGTSGGCTATTTATVTVYTVPVIDISPDITIAIGSSAFLNATGGTTYLWEPATGLSCTTCPNPIASPQSTITYCVHVSDANGCSGSACVTVTIDNLCGDVFVPNAFSPDNNSQNDLECVYGNCIQTMDFAIYDRWGEKVFETSDPKECWDGTYRGKQLNSAVFVYYLYATLITGEKIKKSGNISLMR